MNTNAIPARSNQVKINHIKLIWNGNEQDIIGLVEHIDIFEDMFAPGLSAKIRLRDSYNLVEVIPIIGEEQISISFTSFMNNTRQDTINILLDVVKVSEYALTDSGNEAKYSLYAISKQWHNNLKERLSTHYGTEKTPMKGHEIVHEVCTKILKINQNKLKIDKTRFNRNIVCQNWHPHQLLKYIAETDLLALDTPNSNKDSTFLFFESVDSFNFVAWSSIIEGIFVKGIGSLAFIMKQPENNPGKYTAIVNQVQSWHFDTVISEIDNTIDGVFGNSYIFHDAINKKRIIKTFDYEKEYNKIKFPGNTRKITEKRKNNPFETINILPGDGVYERFIKENSPWKSYERCRTGIIDNNYKLVATINGCSGLKLGEIVDCQLPSPRKNPAGKHDIFVPASGKYIVTRIRHRIDKGTGYVQVVDLRKGARSWTK